MFVPPKNRPEISPLKPVDLLQPLPGSKPPAAAIPIISPVEASVARKIKKPL
jgi:hypothetical protein